MNDVLRVGTWRIPYQDAEKHVKEYTGGGTIEFPYAYPAYDEYLGSGQERIGVQDLFAPSLLSAPMRDLRTFYALQNALPLLNTRLRKLDDCLGIEGKEISLAYAGDDTINNAAALFGILDRDRPYGIRLTTLSKLLHKKRPSLLPIWDRYVEQCYGHDKRVAVRGNKSKQDFVARWMTAIRDDLATYAAQWNALTALAPQGGPPITTLRALDIVVWMSGKRGTFSAHSANEQLYEKKQRP